MKNPKIHSNQTSQSNLRDAKPTSSIGNYDDSYIWDKFKEGDEDALVYIYRNYADNLINYGHRFCKNKDVLKDCLQELFFNLIKNRKNLSATSSIKYYLFKSFRRKVVEKLSSRPELNLALENYELEVTTNVNPESIFINEQLDKNQKKLLEQALQQLSPIQKEIITLYFFEGFSYEKIAGIFEYSHTRSVRNLVYKAIEKMTNYINETGQNLDVVIIMLCFTQFYPL